MTTKDLILCLAVIVFAGLPLTIQAQAIAETDRQAIVTVVDRFMGAWNQHDAKAFAAVFAEDAAFTNWRGTGASGRSRIEESSCADVRNHFQEQSPDAYCHQDPVHTSRCYRRRSALGYDGRAGCQGNPRPDREGLLNFVIAKKDGQWQTLVMHNLDLTALPPANSADLTMKNP